MQGAYYKLIYLQCYQGIITITIVYIFSIISQIQSEKDGAYEILLISYINIKNYFQKILNSIKTCEKSKMRSNHTTLLKLIEEIPKARYKYQWWGKPQESINYIVKNKKNK